MVVSAQEEQIVLAVVVLQNLQRPPCLLQILILGPVQREMRNHKGGLAAFGSQSQRILQPCELRVGIDALVGLFGFRAENDEVIAVDDLIVIGMLQLQVKEGVREPVPAVQDLGRVPFPVAGVVVAKDGQNRLTPHEQLHQPVENHVFQILAAHDAVAEDDDGIVAAFAFGHVLQPPCKRGVAFPVVRFHMHVGNDGKVQLAVFGVPKLILFTAKLSGNKRNNNGNKQRKHAQR